MAEETIGFYMKARIMRNVATFFGTDAPSRRELLIQLDRLKKLEKAYSKKYTKRLTTGVRAGTSMKDIRRSMASDMHRLTLQSKHVDDLFSRVIEEAHQKFYPDAKPVVRKGFKMKGRKFTAGFNRSLKKDVLKVRAEIAAKALEATVGLDKPGL